MVFMFKHRVFEVQWKCYLRIKQPFCLVFGVCIDICEKTNFFKNSAGNH